VLLLLRLENCESLSLQGVNLIFNLVNVAISLFFVCRGKQVFTAARAHLVEEISIVSMSNLEAKFYWPSVQILSKCGQLSDVSGEQERSKLEDTVALVGTGAQSCALQWYPTYTGTEPRLRRC
jgi:hypothetical protein